MTPTPIRRGWSSPAMVVACIALLFSTTGGALAVNKYLARGDPAGGDLTGTYPDPTIGADKVSGAKVLDGSIGSADLAGGSVTPSKFGTIPSARVTNASDQVITALTESLSFDTETFDTAGLHNPTPNSRLTAPIAGTYAITVRVVWHESTSGPLGLRLALNGSSVLDTDVTLAHGACCSSNQIATVARLGAEDYVEARVVAGLGTVVLGGNDLTSMTMTWLGP